MVVYDMRAEKKEKTLNFLCRAEHSFLPPRECEKKKENPSGIEHRAFIFPFVL